MAWMRRHLPAKALFSVEVPIGNAAWGCDLCRVGAIPLSGFICENTGFDLCIFLVGDMPVLFPE